MNVSEALDRAADHLAANGIPEPRREANLLLALALEKDRVFLIANSNYRLTDSEGKVFWGFVKRRARHEPFQHIAGKQEFWGLDFRVTPDVLVPRSETEMIVEETINLFNRNSNIEFCEIGIGSGCISVSVLHDLPYAKAFGYDISRAALEIAKENAETHGVLERLTLGVSDVFEAIEPSRFDLIVSNPPYVPAHEFSGLQTEVRDFDPVEALTDGSDGYTIIRRIINESPAYLTPGGYLLLEIGFNQSTVVSEMFDLRQWKNPDFLPDIQGIPRLVRAQTKNDEDSGPN